METVVTNRMDRLIRPGIGALRFGADGLGNPSYMARGQLGHRFRSHLLFFQGWGYIGRSAAFSSGRRFFIASLGIQPSGKNAPSTAAWVLMDSFTVNSL